MPALMVLMVSWCHEHWHRVTDNVKVLQRIDVDCFCPGHITYAHVIIHGNGIAKVKQKVRIIRRNFIQGIRPGWSVTQHDINMRI